MFCFADGKEKDPGLVERSQRQMSKRGIYCACSSNIEGVYCLVSVHVQRIGEYAGRALQVLGRVAVQKFEKQ